MIGTGRETVDLTGFSPAVMPIVISSHDFLVPFVPSPVTIRQGFLTQGEGMGSRADTQDGFAVRDVFSDQVHGLVRKSPPAYADKE